MKTKKIIISSFIFIIIFTSIYGILAGSSPSSNLRSSYLIEPPTTSDANYEIIDQILDAKKNQFSDHGYFDQYYQSSIQATYYAVSILKAIGMTQEIHTQSVIDYIMSHYNSGTHLFGDIYSERYLDSNFSLIVYPLTSLLQINCYAFLTLDMLNNSNLIDKQGMIDFIWSCYNPDSSGFIGRPYSLFLEQRERTSTMDNTYYAILTLDKLLGEDWSSYSDEKDDLILYIESLQDTYKGGFFNDNDLGFRSLFGNEPNMASSYYAIKSLKLFNNVYVIDYNKFFDFLDDLYHPGEGYFEWGYYLSIPNMTNVVGSAMGVELSLITGYPNINQEAVVAFIMSNINTYGGFDGSSKISTHELLDSYEVVLPLINSGKLSEFTLNDKINLANYIAMCLQYDKGYSLISKDYTSVDLIYTIVSTFNLYDKIPELEVLKIFDLLEGAYWDETKTFSASTKLCATPGYKYAWLRSIPIEYMNFGKRNILEDVNDMMEPESIYKALQSLDYMHKLDEFAGEYGLTSILQKIYDSQFLLSFPGHYGAFMPRSTINPLLYKDLVSIDQSFYAIRAMELIANYLGLGEISSLGFDAAALGTYITYHIEETSTDIFFNSPYSKSLESDFENTYFSVYILKALDSYDLTTAKLRNYIVSHLDYSNIKNIYFAFKISELLDLNINFDVPQVHALVQSIYSPNENEFYQSTNHDIINQDILFWICDMAVNDEIRITIDHPTEVMLGNTVIITADPNNLILSDFGNPSSITMKIESDQLGTIILDDVGLEYQTGIFIPGTSGYFPTVSGNVSMYYGSLRLQSASFSFTTSYEIQTELTYSENPTSVYISVDAFINIFTGIQAVHGGGVYIEVYKDNLHIDTKDFQYQENSEYTNFYLDYFPFNPGEYKIEVYIYDGVNPEAQFVGELTYYCMNPDKTGGYNDEVQASFPMIIMLTAMPGAMLLLTHRKIADKILKITKKGKSKLSK